MAYNLTLKSIQLETIPECTPVIATSWLDANIANSVNRIGEKKLLRIKISSNNNIAQTTVYLNPALFMDISLPPITGKPTTYYSHSYGVSYTVGIATLMAYNSPGSPFPNPGKVNAVFVQPWGLVAGKYDFDLLIYFQQGYDCEGYINPNTDDNHSRFLKDKKSNTSELTVTGQSVYSSIFTDLRAYVYLENNFAPGNNGSLDINPQYGYKAGFYNKGAHNAAPYFSNPIWAVTNSGLATTTFSSAVDCDVEFRCDSPVVPSALVVKMIRTDKFDQTVEQEANYELDVAEITGAGVTTVKFKTPYAGPVFVAGSTYKWNFKINKAGITNGAKYRIIGIVLYQSGPTLQSTSFISPEYDASADVPYTGGALTFTGRLGDIKTQYSGNDLIGTIEERMFSRLTIDFAANAWANNIFSRLGLTTINDLRRYLYSVQFTIKSPFTIPPGYTGEFGEIYDFREALKTGPTSYSPKSGIDLDFSTPDKLILFAEWRNRYESAVANYASVVNGAVNYPGTSNQYWGGLNLIVEWKLTFYYDDYVTPFTDEIIFTQKLFVKDYQPDTILKITAQNPPFDSKEFWCPGEEMCLQGEIVDNTVIDPALGYYLITNIDSEPGSEFNLQESEQWIGSPYLLQQTTPLIYAQETLFEDSVPLKALFCIDETGLILGNDYKVSVIAKRS